MKTTKPENFRKWLDALRSGEYSQTRGALRRTIENEGPFGLEPVGYCCLGVVCEISQLGQWIGRIGFRGLEEQEYRVEGWGHPGYLTPPMMDWLGLDPEETDEYGELLYESEDGDAFTLSVETSDRGRIQVNTLNDEGVDFATIADLLERTYL